MRHQSSLYKQWRTCPACKFTFYTQNKTVSCPKCNHEILRDGVLVA
jgi:rubrerythrin